MERRRTGRYQPDGLLLATIPLPVDRPTCCAFRGRAGETLFITTSPDWLDQAALTRQPHAGRVLRVDSPGARRSWGRMAVAAGAAILRPGSPGRARPRPDAPEWAIQRGCEDRLLDAAVQWSVGGERDAELIDGAVADGKLVPGERERVPAERGDRLDDARLRPLRGRREANGHAEVVQLLRPDDEDVGDRHAAQGRDADRAGWLLWLGGAGRAGKG